MKKLLICALMANLVSGANSETLKDDAQDVLGQFGEAVTTPVILVRDAAVNVTEAILESELAKEARNVGKQLAEVPGQVADDVKKAAVTAKDAIKDGTAKAYQSERRGRGVARSISPYGKVKCHIPKRKWRRRWSGVRHSGR